MVYDERTIPNLLNLQAKSWNHRIISPREDNSIIGINFLMQEKKIPNRMNKTSARSQGRASIPVK